MSRMRRPMHFCPITFARRVQRLQCAFELFARSGRGFEGFLLLERRRYRRRFLEWKGSYPLESACVFLVLMVFIYNTWYAWEQIFFCGVHIRFDLSWMHESKCWRKLCTRSMRCTQAHISRFESWKKLGVDYLKECDSLFDMCACDGESSTYAFARIEKFPWFFSLLWYPSTILFSSGTWRIVEFSILAGFSSVSSVTRVGFDV